MKLLTAACYSAFQQGQDRSTVCTHECARKLPKTSRLTGDSAGNAIARPSVRDSANPLVGRTHGRTCGTPGSSGTNPTRA